MERSCLGDSRLVKCEEETMRRRRRWNEEREGEEEEGGNGVNNNKTKKSRSRQMGWKRTHKPIWTLTNVQTHADAEKSTENTKGSRNNDTGGVWDAASYPDGVSVVVMAAWTEALFIERSWSSQSQNQTAQSEPSQRHWQSYIRPERARKQHFRPLRLPETFTLKDFITPELNLQSWARRNVFDEVTTQVWTALYVQPTCCMSSCADRCRLRGVQATRLKTKGWWGLIWLLLFRSRCLTKYQF